MNRWMKVAGLLAILVIVLAVAGLRAQQTAAKKGYVIARVHVTDPQKYGEYANVAPAITVKYGGRYLARGGRTATLEGPEVADRMVIVEFPSFDEARAFYDSPEYTAARKIRAGAADASFVLIEGQ